MPQLITEKDLKALLLDAPPTTFFGHMAENDHYSLTFEYKKKAYAPATIQGRLRTFRDLTRLIKWSETVGAARVVIDISF